MKKILAITMIAGLVSPVLASPIEFAPPQTEAAIQTIRQHYTHINRDLRKYRKVKKEMSGYSTEGGDLTAYFNGPTIMKIVANFYGESGKALEEYYYWDGKLIFVFRKESRYNKPLSGKVVATTENRFYFSNDKLIRWIDEKAKRVASDTSEYIEKQKEYLESSKEFIRGAGSPKSTIESNQ